MVLRCLLLFLMASSLEAKDIKKNGKVVKKSTKSKVNVYKAFSVGLYSFQNRTKIKTPDTPYSNLNYTTIGLIFGYNESITNGSLKIGTSFSLFYGNTDARTDSIDLYYFKKQLPTYGVVGGLSFLFSMNSEHQYYLGPEANVYYMQTKWFVPVADNGTWTIEKTAKPQFSFLLVGEYYYKSLMFYHKLGFPIGGTSFIWNLGVGLQL